MLDGAAQIAPNTIPWGQMVTGAIVPTTSLIDGALFLERWFLTVN
jgi:hypothetical protein